MYDLKKGIMKNLKKMSVKFYLMLALSAVAVLAGCKDDEEVVTPQFPDLKEQTVTLTETTDENGNNVFSASLDITFSANLDWTLKSDAAWCRFVNGEIKETTASGKAGDQTLKVEISDASWNYTSADVAQITLSMASQEQVIYKITRGTREYKNLVVTNEAGDISYSSSTPLEIKGNNANVVTTSLRASAEAGMKIGLQYPEWLTMSINQETGSYDFTFNTESGEDIRYPKTNSGDVISFFTSDAETAETDKVRRIDIPVSYEGFDKRALVIQSAHNGLSVDADGTINIEEEQVESVSSTIIANSNDFEILKGLQTKKYDDPENPNLGFSYTYDFEENANINWIEVSGPTDDGVVTLSVKANETEEDREAIVVLLPRALAEECGTNYNDYLLIADGDVDDEGNPLDNVGDLKPEFNTFTMASLTQEGKKDESSVSFVGSVPGAGMSFDDVTSNFGSGYASINPSEDASVDTDNVYEITICGELLGYGVQLEVLNFESGMSIEYDEIDNVDISISDNKITLASTASYTSGEYTSQIRIKNSDGTLVAVGIVKINTKSLS